MHEIAHMIRAPGYVSKHNASLSALNNSHKAQAPNPVPGQFSDCSALRQNIKLICIGLKMLQDQGWDFVP